MRYRGVLFIFVGLCLPAAFLPAQGIDLTLTPGASIPLGPLSASGEKVYTLGAGAELAGRYLLPFAPFLYGQGFVGYDLVSTLAQTTLSMVSVGAGAGVRFSPASVLSFDITGAGGFCLAIYGGGVGGTGVVAADVTASFLLSPSFGLGLGASFKHAFGLYTGIGVHLGTIFHLGAGQRRSKMEIREIRLTPVFPVFQRYYDTHELGEVVIRNGENGPITDVRATFFVKQFMDQPKESELIPEMRKGEELTVPLFGLFTPVILGVTEGTKAAAEITVHYRLGEIEMAAVGQQSLEIYHRNAMTWDDDRRAASFVTSMDPGVLKLAKAVGGLVRDEGAGGISLPLRQGMGVFEALRLAGINYVIDPKSSYAEFSASETAVDYLQFPTQTLGYKAGDCDDLSILYAALLESIGVETAFITVPGHIFAAFGLGMSEEEARKAFDRPDDLIVRDGRAWVPVEITLVRAGFLQAWQEGAREWREHSDKGTARLYPVREAWAMYPATGFESPESAVTVPDSASVLSAFRQAMARFIERETQQRVAALREEIRANNGSPKLVNRLGLLYAQYGQYTPAEEQFALAARSNHLPAIINLGNVLYLRKALQEALVQYNRALERDAANVSVLVGLAKVQYDLKNYGAVKELYKKIQDTAPEVAAKYSYLGSGTQGTERASDASARLGVEWDEE